MARRVQGSAVMPDRDLRARAVKILAKSLARDLARQGFDDRDVLALATELIGQVTSAVADQKQVRRRA